VHSFVQGPADGSNEDRKPVRDLVERLMERAPAPRFEFIQQRASAIEDDAIDA